MMTPQTEMVTSACLLILLSLSLAQVPKAEPLNVLVLQPLHGASHEAQLRTLSDELLKRGHHVTAVRFLPAKRNYGGSSKADTRSPPRLPANFSLISLTVPNEDGSVPFVTKGRHGRFELPLELLWTSGLCPFQMPLSAYKTNDALCSVLLDGRLKRRLLPSYDVAVVDAFGNECGFALAHSLGVPAVAYWAMPISGGEADYLAGLWRPPLMAQSPGILTKLTDQMTYFQRVFNAFSRVLGDLVMQVQFWYTHAAIQRHLPGTPHPRRLLEDAAGLLENSDVALDYPKPLPPNVINVGCMQCRQPQPLPRTLEEFVEGSGNAGIVVFSMGATIDAAVAPRAFFRRLLRAFSRLPQRVVMKFAGPVDDEDVPANVRILPWMPQQDLLGHKRTQVFFAHCGLHGAMEAIYHGVPVVGMPIFADQTDVASMLEDKGIGIRLAKNADEDEIYRALSEVIGDPRYRRNVLKQQQILLDAPQTAMERALWFVEYVARHHGASHLRLSTRHYSAIQLFGLDVLPTLLLLASVPLFITYKIIIALLQLMSKVVVWSFSKFQLSSTVTVQEASETHFSAEQLVGSISLMASSVAYLKKFLQGALLFITQSLLPVSKDTVQRNKPSSIHSRSSKDQVFREMAAEATPIHKNGELTHRCKHQNQ